MVHYVPKRSKYVLYTSRIPWIAPVRNVTGLDFKQEVYHFVTHTENQRDDPKYDYEQ